MFNIKHLFFTYVYCSITLYTLYSFLMSNIIYINFLLEYNIIILINNNLILFYKLYMIR